MCLDFSLEEDALEWAVEAKYSETAMDLSYSLRAFLGWMGFLW